jgi:predicted Fe-Mo cluster-binding NifX family protein
LITKERQLKLGIPTNDGKTVSSIFGRANSFAVYNTDTAELIVLANEGIGAEHGAGTGAASFLAEQGVSKVLAPEVGPKALSALSTAGITVVRVDAGTDILQAVRLV